MSDDPLAHDDPLEYIVDVQRLDIRQDDILVIRTDYLLNKEQVTAVRERLEEAIGDRLKEWNVRILVLTGAFDMAVLRKEVLEQL